MNTALESIRLALKALVANKVRAILTMLGIIIGVGAVITLVSVGNGFSNYVTSQFEGLGTNLLTLNADHRANENTGQPLTMGDVERLENDFTLQGVDLIAPVYQGNVMAQYEVNETDTTATGVTSAYQTVRNYEVTIGRFVTDEDSEYRSRVAVLGSEVAADLFPDSDYPIGESIRLNDISFEVVGVLAEKGDTGPTSNDDLIMIPLSTAQTRLFSADSFRGDYVVSSINIQAKSEADTDIAIDSITAILREYHGLEASEDDDFYLGSQAGPIGLHLQYHHGLNRLFRLYCRYFFAGRWHWHYEYYAGLGYRAHPRNWSTQSHWGWTEGYFASVHH